MMAREPLAKSSAIKGRLEGSAHCVIGGECCVTHLVRVAQPSHLTTVSGFWPQICVRASRPQFAGRRARL
jgi:hypothetical protein